jgi:ABC-type methionine transport system permease subunit
MAPRIMPEGMTMAAKHRKMGKREYRAALEQLELGIVEAGEVFGVSKRQTIRYAMGHSQIPEAVAKLIRLTLMRNINPDTVREL